eukprot:4521057-Pleurochrysis_carterae.AAC.1
MKGRQVRLSFGDRPLTLGRGAEYKIATEWCRKGAGQHVMVDVRQWTRKWYSVSMPASAVYN